MRNLILIVLFVIVIVFLTQPTKEYYENPQTSSSSEVGAGASVYFDWGGPDIKDKHKKKDQPSKRQERKCHKCDHTYISDDVCNIIIDERHGCKYCDITKNKNIDKYVLKSSVPPCPDMSKYATKAMLQPQVDMNKYMLKSKLPEYCSAYQPDKSKYMLKTQCAPQEKYIKVYKDITNHPQFNKYVSKEHCKQYKKSWTQNFEEWWENMFGGPKGGKQDRRQGGRQGSFPTGYAYSPYAGYGTNNPGYALDGGYVKERHFATPETR